MSSRNSSANRPTAFARTPRGGSANTTARSGADKLVRMDARFMERLEQARPSDDLATVMTSLGASLQVSKGPQGGTETNLVFQGTVLADKSDIQKIQSLSSNITKERKIALKEDSVAANRVILASFLQVSRRVQKPITKFPATFLDLYRPINASLATLAKNLNAIEPVTVVEGTGQALVRKMCLEFGKRIRFAMGEFLFYRANLAEGEVPRKLNSFLRENCVPAFVTGRLTNAVINVAAPGFDLRTIFYPSDPTKGFYLTYREIVEDVVTESLGGLLEGADVMMSLFENNQRIIRKLINVSNEFVLDDFDVTNSWASKVAGTPFFVPPTPAMVEPSQIFSYLAKNGARGVQWQSGTTLSPQDNLKFVGTIAKRMSYLLFPRPAQKGGLFQELFEGFAYERDADLDVYTQLKAYASVAGRNLDWFNYGKHAKWASGSVRVKLERAFSDVLGVDYESEMTKDFRSTLTNEDGIFEYVGKTVGENIEGEDLLTEVKNHAVLIQTRPGADLVAEIGSTYVGTGIRETIPDKKRGRERVPGMTERTALANETRAVLASLRQTGHAALAKRMEAWFRQFLTLQVQLAVANLFAARIQAFLEQPVEYTRAERLAFMEPDEIVGDTDEDIGAEGEEPPPESAELPLVGDAAFA